MLALSLKRGRILRGRRGGARIVDERAESASQNSLLILNPQKSRRGEFRGVQKSRIRNRDFRPKIEGFERWLGYRPFANPSGAEVKYDIDNSRPNRLRGGGLCGDSRPLMLPEIGQPTVQEANP
jgi:hypothetical protein